MSYRPQNQDNFKKLNEREPDRDWIAVVVAIGVLICGAVFFYLIGGLK